MVTLPNEEGGLGVIDLRKHNEALMMKNLHKFFNQLDIPWVSLVWEKHYPNGKLPSDQMKGSFWWKANLKNLKIFRNLSKVQVKNGKCCHLWDMTSGWMILLD